MTSSATDLPLDEPAWQQAWTEQYAAPLPPRAARGQQAFMVFVLGGETFALPVRDIAAAADPAPMVALPGRRERIVWGLFHHDGLLVPAAGLRRLLKPAARAPGPSATRGAFARVLLLGRDGESFAAAVDDVPGSVRLAPEQIVPMPVTAPAGIARLARGMHRHGAVQLTVLDGTRLLAALADDLRPQP